MSQTRNKALTVAGLLATVGVMVVLVSYSVTLYNWFCDVTGYGGTTQVAEAAPTAVGERRIEIRFDANVNAALPWSFAPVEKTMIVNLGEQKLAFYEAANLSGNAVTGTATFNVSPAKAGQYFNKLECFCFTEQVLEPGQQVDMPVAFFVDPEMAGDPNLADVTSITLSYTFFRQDAGTESAPKISNADPAPAGRFVN